MGATVNRLYAAVVGEMWEEVGPVLLAVSRLADARAADPTADAWESLGARCLMLADRLCGWVSLGMGLRDLGDYRDRPADWAPFAAAGFYGAAWKTAREAEAREVLRQAAATREGVDHAWHHSRSQAQRGAAPGRGRAGAAAEE